jgi:hypothetical protein
LTVVVAVAAAVAAEVAPEAVVAGGNDDHGRDAEVRIR